MNHVKRCSIHPPVQRVPPVLAFFLLISVVLLAVNETPQIRAIRSLAVVVRRHSCRMLFGFIPNYFDLRRENKVLREHEPDAWPTR